MKYIEENVWTLVIIGVVILMLIGWVIPEVPYIRRMKIADAENLHDKYLALIKNAKTSNSADIAEANMIVKKLTHAGYAINPGLGVENAGKFGLMYPKYAQ